MSTEPNPGEEEPADDGHVIETEEKVRAITPYEKRLRTEATNARAKLRAAEAERDAAKQSVTAAEAKARDDIEAARTAARTEAEARIIRAEIKAAALAAGMVDLDGLKLLDLSAVKLDEAGEVTVPDGFFDAARQAKPYLFGATSTTSTPGRPPPPNTPAAKKATEMSDEEWRAARAQVLNRR